MQVKIINHSPNPLPSFETAGSAGMDLYAWLEGALELKPLERKLISTGISIELPLGYEAQIRARSGTAAKKGLAILNSPGTIDSDYRGEIKMIVVNLSNQSQTIENGERIGQMVVAKYEQVQWEEVGVLNDTDRGINGFGHTGIK